MLARKALSCYASSMESKKSPRHLTRRVLIEAGGLLLALAWLAAFVYVVDAILY